MKRWTDSLVTEYLTELFRLVGTSRPVAYSDMVEAQRVLPIDCRLWAPKDAQHLVAAGCAAVPLPLLRRLEYPNQVGPTRFIGGRFNKDGVLRPLPRSGQHTAREIWIQAEVEREDHLEKLKESGMVIVPAGNIEVREPVTRKSKAPVAGPAPMAAYIRLARGMYPSAIVIDTHMAITIGRTELGQALEDPKILVGMALDANRNEDLDLLKEVMWDQTMALVNATGSTDLETVMDCIHIKLPKKPVMGDLSPAQVVQANTEEKVVAFKEEEAPKKIKRTVILLGYLTKQSLEIQQRCVEKYPEYSFKWLVCAGEQKPIVLPDHYHAICGSSHMNSFQFRAFVKGCDNKGWNRTPSSVVEAIERVGELCKPLAFASPDRRVVDTDLRSLVKRR